MVPRERHGETVIGNGGVSDLDVLMNFLRPEMVKRLTENERV